VRVERCLHYVKALQDKIIQEINNAKNCLIHEDHVILTGSKFHRSGCPSGIVEYPEVLH